MLINNIYCSITFSSVNYQTAYFLTAILSEILFSKDLGVPYRDQHEQ